MKFFAPAGRLIFYPSRNEDFSLKIWILSRVIIFEAVTMLTSVLIEHMIVQNMQNAEIFPEPLVASARLFSVEKENDDICFFCLKSCFI